jgi:signal transduction histidine kinase
VDAALSISYRDRKEEWVDDEERSLRLLFESTIVPLLVEVASELAEEVGRSAPHLVKILAHTWHLTSLAQQAGNPHLCIKAILKAAFDALRIPETEGGGSIYWLQPDGNTLVRKEFHGCIDAKSQEKHYISEGIGVVAWVAERRQPALINDLHTSVFSTKGIYVPCLRGVESLSELAVPIIDGDQLLGVLNLECPWEDAFEWHSVGFLSHAASQAAINFRLAQNWLAENVAKFFHTFRSPLFTITGTLEQLGRMLEKGVDREEFRRRLGLAMAEAERYQRIVGNSTFWIKAEPSVSKGELLVGPVCESIVELHQQYALLKRCTLICRVDGRLELPIMTNRTLFELILYNLIQNALDHGGAGTQVCVSLNVSAKQDQIQLDVMDNGRGMSPELMKQAMLHSIRGSMSHGTDGLGIGLTICAKAVNLLGGTMAITSNQPRGVFVQIVLPIQ